MASDPSDLVAFRLRLSELTDMAGVVPGVSYSLETSRGVLAVDKVTLLAVGLSVEFGTKSAIRNRAREAMRGAEATLMLPPSDPNGSSAGEVVDAMGILALRRLEVLEDGNLSLTTVAVVNRHCIGQIFLYLTYHCVWASGVRT